MPHGPSAVSASKGERLINSLSDCPDDPHPMSYVPDGESIMAVMVHVGSKVGRLIGTAAVLVIEKIESVTEDEDL